ncbi:MAG: hypothetical protein HYS25_04515 [Ignavibacteriales bacterium]|nr:hypothetical protein [Ignavibacteriales bacterium]
MRKVIKLSVITIFALLVFVPKINAQTIDVNIFQELSAVDLSAFDFENLGADQPRIMQIVINPPGVEVYLEGSIVWKKDENSSFQTVGTFKTRPFLSRTIYNDEFNKTDIELERTDYNSAITDDILKKGKPSGIFVINFFLYSPIGQQLDSDVEEFRFLNPTAPTIISPNQGFSYDVGTVLAQWTASIGATTYRLSANYVADNETNYEQALTSRTPIINNYDVGNVTTVNLRDVLNGELLPDTNVVLVVKAVIQKPGGEDELASPIVMFKTNPVGKAPEQHEVNQDIAKLANVLTGLISQEFLDKLTSGNVSPQDFKITDENGKEINFNDFVAILNFLEQNKDAVINVNFIAK